MKKIKLTQNKVAIVDDEDFEYISQYKWSYSYYGYARGWVDGEVRLMHRVLMDAPHKTEVDHKNANKLDNRRSNLRLCTSSQNKQNNRLRIDNTIGFKGVAYDKRRNKYFARVQVGGKSKWLGYFKTALEAAKKYDEAARIYYGEFAYINKDITT